jgi:hypothetical protein
MMKSFGFSFGQQQSPSNRVPDSWPPQLKSLHRIATSALKGLRRARRQPLSGSESVERDDQLTMMETMANPNKTAAVVPERAGDRNDGAHMGRFVRVTRRL